MKDVRKSITLFFLVMLLAACGAPAQPTFPPPPAAPMTPVTHELDGGLTWTECILPDGEYSSADEDLAVIAKCLNADVPALGSGDEKIFAERIPGEAGDNFRLTIGGDKYETRYASRQDGVRYEYELLKNGTVVSRTEASFFTFPPNLTLANIGGKAVWEVAAEPHVIFADGVDLNQANQLEGSFVPYEIKGKLLYIAKKGGKYRLVYDGKAVGPEFDEISLAFCCAEMRVFYGQGRYLFVGKRDGKRFAVLVE